MITHDEAMGLLAIGLLSGSMVGLWVGYLMGIMAQEVAQPSIAADLQSALDESRG